VVSAGGRDWYHGAGGVCTNYEELFFGAGIVSNAQIKKNLQKQV
jgi:hypothetical protein